MNLTFQRIGNRAVTKFNFSSGTVFLRLINLFFFLVLVLPTTFQAQRGLFLAVLVVAGVGAAIRNWRVSQDILMLWLLILAMGAFFTFWGFINHAPGALRVSTVYLVWPFIYMLFIGLAHDFHIIVELEKTLIVGAMICCLMALMLVFGSALGYAHQVSGFFRFQGADINIYTGYIELRLYNLTTVIYSLPFLVVLILLPHKKGWMNRRWKLLAELTLLLVIVVCVLSGRRAFWLLALLTPTIVFGLFLLGRIQILTRQVGLLFAVATIVILASTIAFKIDLLALINHLTMAFNYLGEHSASIRYQQFVALISGWCESPFVGKGLGATTEAIVRSRDTPWAYELSYVALLFQTGLIGLSIYTGTVLWIFYAGIKAVRHQKNLASIIMPLLAGLAGFLLINATNPYLQKFDYLWTIFLPVAALNVYRIHSRALTLSSSTGIPQCSSPIA